MGIFVKKLRRMRRYYGGKSNGEKCATQFLKHHFLNVLRNNYNLYWTLIIIGK